MILSWAKVWSRCDHDSDKPPFRGWKIPWDGQVQASWNGDQWSICNWQMIWHLEKLGGVRTRPLNVSRCWQFSQYVCPCHILQFTHPDIAVLKSCTCRCSAGRLAGRIRSFKAGWQMRVPLLEKRPLPTWIFESVDTFHARNVFWDSDCLLLVSQNFGTLA